MMNQPLLAALIAFETALASPADEDANSAPLAAIEPRELTAACKFAAWLDAGGTGGTAAKFGKILPTKGPVALLIEVEIEPEGGPGRPVPIAAARAGMPDARAAPEAPIAAGFMSDTTDPRAPELPDEARSAGKAIKKTRVEHERLCNRKGWCLRENGNR